MDPSLKTRSDSDFKMDQRVDDNADNKANGHKKEKGGDINYKEAEGATGIAGDIMGVKLEYKMVEEELLHPNDPKEGEEEKEEVETRKAKSEKVKIITI